MRSGIAWTLLLTLWACLAGAHTMTLTEVTVSFTKPGTLDVDLGVDLTQILGSPDRYYAFVTETPRAQQSDVDKLLPTLLAGLQLVVGATPLKLDLQEFSTAGANKTLILDSQMSTLTRFHLIARLPDSREALRLLVPIGVPIDYPVVYTILIPSAQVSMTRWLEDGAHESEPYDWYAKTPHADSSRMPVASNTTVAGPTSLPWYRQAVLYLRLGFKHIVPEGADHILFVLGLFFLGITWRKLLSQTTVFTVAHATTLFLSTYGIVSLPSRYIEPAIALSIVWIAIENVFKPRLGPGRLAVVFAFGLVHGLGFASSLSDIPFPHHDFVWALLGFNIGVDVGQLFVIATAFLIVGWFRRASWFRSRIAVPASLVIAAIGLVWAVQRVIFFTRH